MERTFLKSDRVQYCGHFEVWSQVYLHMFVYHQNPWNAETSAFCKVDMFPSPDSTWTVHDSLGNPDARLLPCKLYATFGGFIDWALHVC